MASLLERAGMRLFAQRPRHAITLSIENMGASLGASWHGATGFHDYSRRRGAHVAAGNARCGSPHSAAARHPRRAYSVCGLRRMHPPCLRARGTNFSSGDAVVEKVEVFGDGTGLATLDRAAIASRLQPAGLRESRATMAPSTQALLFVHVILPQGAAIPIKLSHDVTARVGAAPAGERDIRETGGETPVDRRNVVVIGPPLRGERYLAADSCCDATRHTRADRRIRTYGLVSRHRRF
jgi:hypothetical protein